MVRFLRPANDRLFDWILGLGSVAKYNLTSSGLSEPNLSAMGIDTSFERFATEKDEHAKRFAEEVSALYRVEVENVVITNGASEAIFLVYSVLGEGGRAIVPLPNYGPMFTVPSALGMKVGNDIGAGPYGARIVFGLTDPNNPTGIGLERGTVERAASSWGMGSFVFVNETYREFTFSSSPETHFGSANDVVVCSTMTKFYGLGRLRVGWIIAEKDAARRLSYGKWAISGHNSEYSLWIATQVLRNRQRFVARARSVCSKNVKVVRSFLEETKGVSTQFGETPFCLVHYNKERDSVSLAKALLRKRGVLVAPGDFFGARKAFRLCFTSEEETLRAGLGELSRFFNGT